MSITDSLLKQYLLTFGSLVLISYLCPCIGPHLSLLGLISVLSFISWHLVKTFRRYMNTELITTNKRAVIITGCDSGFGNATALSLNEHGYKVYATVLDPNSEGAKKLLTCAKFKGMTKVVRMDVTKDEDVKALYEQIKSDLQENKEILWGVVNNADISTFGLIDWGTMGLWKKIFDVNFFGTVQMTRTFLPLIRQSGGRIVNFGSGIIHIPGPNLAVYKITKVSVNEFSHDLRRENKKWGIKVSTIEPMGYRTEFNSIEGYKSIVDNHWNQTSDDVKQEYGQEYYENFRNNSPYVKFSSRASTKLSEVVDKVLEALRNPEPKHIYLVSSYSYERIIFYLLSFLPIEFNESIFEFIFNKLA